MDYYLSQHPRIHMCPSDKQGFFNQDELFEKGFPNPELYNLRFENHSGKVLRGEVCADYMYRPQCMSRLSIYNSEIKVIAILRNPAERAYSHWQMNVTQGLESLSFREAIELEKEMLKFPEKDQSNPTRSYLSRGFYSDQIKNLLQYFDPHQLLFIRCEDLRDDTEVSVYRVLQFLSLPFLEMERTPKNLGDYQTSMNPEDYNDLIEIFTNDIQQTEKMLGWRCYDWMRPVQIRRPMMDYIES